MGYEGSVFFQGMQEPRYTPVWATQHFGVQGAVNRKTGADFFEGTWD